MEANIYSQRYVSSNDRFLKSKHSAEPMQARAAQMVVRLRVRQYNACRVIRYMSWFGAFGKCCTSKEPNSIALSQSPRRGVGVRSPCVPTDYVLNPDVRSLEEKLCSV
eukprot:11946229-Heterocapsa_arctica.AAC.1